ncbi:STM4015 family protein [Streptomyces cylindrosporus]|uniref:STM4015 family protein n=1 Tax=Streptomyces cylindrosporus TaxID=2927583 RepID=A0ABS9Y0L1_9ACTN|nr:STM4015 family protein [Streptomyces cylindrosporus]MCI3270720.1 STM4015 family protein [Streptomyces cylindrosporus]
MFFEDVTVFAGYYFDWNDVDESGEAVRLRRHWENDAPFSEIWQEFKETFDLGTVEALVISDWWSYGDQYEESLYLEPVLGLLTDDASQMTSLRALFIGERERPSLGYMADVTPVLEAFPQLEYLTVRGNFGVALRPVRHDKVRDLRFESGGLPKVVVQGIAGSELTALEHLEVWLGAEEWGAGTTLDDLEPLLAGGRFPALRHLGIRNSEFQDEIAVAVARAPVVARLDSLSLSHGTLSDAGADALLDGQSLTHLSRLDLQHNYLTAEAVRRVREALEPNGVEVDLSSTVGPDQERSVAISE